MIDLSAIRDLVAIFGVIAGFSYYYLTVRNTIKARKTQQVSRLRESLYSEKLQSITMELMEMSWTDLEDFDKKYDSTVNKDNYVKRWLLFGIYQEIGYLLREGLIDIDVVCGMIQYLPIEYSMFEGENLHAVLCIWVHGHKEGIGDRRKKGMGKALLQAAEKDCREMGSLGLAAWGLSIPAWMRASWFRKQGYKVVDRSGIMRMLWKPFSEEAVPPKFMLMY